MTNLGTYHKKRHFNKTPEPFGKKPKRHRKSQNPLFVVQKHAASHLHYDFRLELNGVLVSWAVPKGPCLDPTVKRLAIHVEDHPLKYANFEGTIPAGQYGAGSVSLWDKGYWLAEDQNVNKAYKAGNMTFTLKGKKLKGKWKLIRIKQDDKSWLLIKTKDESSINQKNETANSIFFSDLKNHKTSPFSKRISAQLATLVDEPPSGKNWLHEIKFDGYRILAFKRNNKTHLWTRNQQDWTEKFPFIAKQINQLPVKNLILDGEIVALNEHQHSNFQLLQNAIKDGKSDSLIYYIFDLIYIDRHNLTKMPLIKRKELLHQLIPSSTNPVLRYSDHVLGFGKKTWINACKLGLEGIVSKEINSLYVQRRTKTWLKTKCIKRQEFVIGGFTKSKANNPFGSLLLGTYDKHNHLIYNGKVGTGFTQDSLKNIYDLLIKFQKKQSPFHTKVPDSKIVTWIKPILVAEVEFTEWTSENRLRHPSFKGLRKDKAATHVVKEQATSLNKLKSKPSKIEVSKPAAVEFGKNSIKITHSDKILYPEDKITKYDLVHYYEQITPWIMPYIKDRPLMLVRCPNGYQECFHQKHIYEAPSSSLQEVNYSPNHPIHSPSHPVHGSTGSSIARDGTESVIFIKNQAHLLELCQLNTLEIHPWGSKIKKIEYPDIIVFDLDPAPKVPWKKVVTAAFEMKKHLEELNLKSFVKTTGGKGLHIVIPIKPEFKWKQIKQFAQAFVELIVLQSPNQYVSTMAKTERKGKIFLDYLRNQEGATAIAPYSTRAHKHAPIATPIDWSELTEHREDTFYTLQTLPNRLKNLRKDPWESFFKLKQSLKRLI